MNTELEFDGVAKALETKDEKPSLIVLDLPTNVKSSSSMVDKSNDPTFADESKMLIDIMGQDVCTNFDDTNKLGFHKVIL